MADVVRIEISVDDKGSPVVKQVSDSLKNLGDKAGESSAGMLKLKQAGEELKGILSGVSQEGAGLLGRFSGLLSVIGPVGVGIGALAYAAQSSLKEFAAFGTQVRDLAFLSGGTAKQVSVLVSGLEALGVSSEAVETGMNRMSAAVTKGDPVINRLGISIRGANGENKNALQLFYETVDALGKMTNATERNSLSRDIFGRGWTEMLPVLRKGSDAIQKIGEESGKAVTEADLARLAAYKLAVHDIYEIFDRLKINFGAGIVVPVTGILKWLTPSGGTNYPTPKPGMTAEQAWREAFPGLSKNMPTSYATYGAYDDQSLHGGGLQYKYKQTTELNIQEIQRKMFASDTALLRAQGRGLGAVGFEDSAQAYEDTVNAQLAKSLAGLPKQAKEEGWTDAETSSRRAAIQGTAAQQIAKYRRDQGRSERMRVAGLDKGLGIGEGNVGVGLNMMDEEESQRAIAALTSHYIKAHIEEVAEEEKRVREIREAGYAFDDTANQQRVEDFTVSEAEVATQRIESLEKVHKREVERAEWEKDERERTTREDKLALEGRMAATDDFYEKVRLGLALNTRNYETETQRMIRLTQSFAQAATQSLDDLFFNVLTGRFSSMSDVLKQFGLSLARIASGELAKSTMSYLGSGDTLNSAANIGSKVVSGVSAVWDYLGSFDAGNWKVTGGSGSSAGAWGASTTKKPSGWAYLHPDEMVVPSDIADKLRKVVESLGLSGFEGLSEVVEGGSGRGGSNSASGAYGQMTSEQRSSLSSLGGFGNFGFLSTSFGVASGLLGMGSLGKTAIDAMISSILGFDAVRNQLGVDPNWGWVSPTEADYQGIRDTFGVFAEQAARAKDAQDQADYNMAQTSQTLGRDSQQQAEADAQNEMGNPSADARSGDVSGQSPTDSPSADGQTGDSRGDTSGSRGNGPGDGSNDYATGALFSTRGRTRMTVGEAGRETVAVLRNPRDMSLDGGSGIQIVINNSGVLGSQLPENLMREITRELDRRASRRIVY
jgi:hypothetical protein